jgi:hypothetical protein
VSNGTDNCVFDTNSDQADADGDGVGDECDSDLDGDGVLDALDACVPTPNGKVVDASGCSISQLVPCEFPLGSSSWRSHGAYVSAVVAAANDFVAAGLISGADKGAIVSAAAQSTCGNRN